MGTLFSRLFLWLLIATLPLYGLGLERVARTSNDMWIVAAGVASLLLSFAIAYVVDWLVRRRVNSGGWSFI